MKPPRPRTPSTKPTSGESTPVIALSRYRAQLGRGKRLRRADVLFSSPDPAHAIRALPGDEFFYVLQEIGFPEAMEILLHATPAQVQTVLDFAIWDRDLVKVEELDSWLELLANAPFEVAGAWFRGIDVEMFALMLRKKAVIYDLSHGEPPDDPEGHFFSTPDNLFVLDVRGSEDSQRVMGRLIDSLYRYDREWMRRLLLGAMGDLDAELEETAFRWRSGRMADLGFEDYYNALGVYSEIDPAKVRVKEGGGPAVRTRTEADRQEEPFLRVPTMLAERMTAGSPFAKAVAGITSAAELTEVHQALVLLCNRVLAADRITPGDEKATASVLTRVAATLDLAVEFLARGSEEKAVAAVRTVELVRLFQLATTLIGKVRALALTLARAKLHPSIDLFEDEDAENIQTLAQLRPLYPCRLDTPPEPDERPFASLGDLSRATAALERAAAAMAMLHALGLRPKQLLPDALNAAGIPDPEALDTGVIVRTWLLHHLTGKAADVLKPVPADLVDAFNKKMNGPKASPRVQTEIKDRARGLLQTATPAALRTPAATAVIERWVESLDPLGPVLTAGNAPPTGSKRKPPRR